MDGDQAGPSTYSIDQPQPTPAPSVPNPTAAPTKYAPPIFTPDPMPSYRNSGPIPLGGNSILDDKRIYIVIAVVAIAIVAAVLLLAHPGSIGTPSQGSKTSVTSTIAHSSSGSSTGNPYLTSQEFATFMKGNYIEYYSGPYSISVTSKDPAYGGLNGPIKLAGSSTGYEVKYVGKSKNKTAITAIEYVFSSPNPGASAAMIVNNSGRKDTFTTGAVNYFNYSYYSHTSNTVGSQMRLVGYGNSYVVVLDVEGANSLPNPQTMAYALADGSLN